MSQVNSIRVFHVTTSLEGGGAEWLLTRLLERMDRGRFDSRVISLRDRGTLGTRICALGIPVDSLNISASLPNPLAVIRLARLIRKYRPQVIQTWLYYADLLGFIASRIAAVDGLCWGIHACDVDLGECSRFLRLVMPALVRLSPFPQAAVVASQKALQWHERLGYRPRRWVQIPVGVDLNHFRPDPSGGARLRRELGIEPDAQLVGLVARFHPMKDHCTFLRAMARLVRRLPRTHVVMAGIGVTRDNCPLAEQIRELGLAEHVHILGERTDVNRILSGLDVLCSSSYTESCPTVVCEAMACEVPCAVTDAGDSALIVGDTGKVVPCRDPAALAEACAELLSEPAEVHVRRGQTARRRIQAHFSIESVVFRYERLYEQLAGGHEVHPERISLPALEKSGEA